MLDVLLNAPSIFEGDKDPDLILGDRPIDLGIHPADRGVSTQHAVLRISDSGLTITDLGSTNGTTLNDSEELLVNGDETPLRDGDRNRSGAPRGV